MQVDSPHPDSQVEKPEATFHQENTTGRIMLSGDWILGSHLPDPASIIDPSGISVLEINADKVGRWDAGLLTFLLKVKDYIGKNDVELKLSLPEGASKLYRLATSVPQQESQNRREQDERIATKVGRWYLRWWGSVTALAEFCGSLTMSLLRLARGQAKLRTADVVEMIRRAGPGSLAIVSLISILVGIIIAFLGAVVLQQFGGEIYIAYLVGYGMLREMGPIMAGIIIAGRNGAAFAAEIGTMKVNEEIDALETLGISPMDFVVLPRFLALFLMMPLLTVYADVVGIIGGLIVNTGLLGIAPEIYFEGIKAAAALDDFFLGLFKGAVFGGIIALCGCMKGLQSGRSADEVGKAATRAVVSSITFIIMANAFIDYAAQIFGI